MAVSTDGWFSNAIQGIPQVGADFCIFDKHTTPRYAVGTRIKRQDGSEFVYSHFGADTNRGVLVSTDVSESSVVDTDNVIIASASAANTNDGKIGSRFIQLTLAAVTQDQFAGGYFITTDDTGEGYTYRVKGNTATDVPATGDIRLELCEKLQVAVGTTTDIAIQGSLYANLEVATGATDNCVAGVSCSTMTVATAAYGWIQTVGVCGILQTTDELDAGGAGDLIAIGDTVVLSKDTAGAVTKLHDITAEVADEEIIGVCLIAGDSSGHGVFKVRIS